MNNLDIQQEIQQEELNEVLFGLAKICELFLDADKKETALKEKV